MHSRELCLTVLISNGNRQQKNNRDASPQVTLVAQGVK